ncbi:UDP-glucose 4-epimerase GalE [Methylotenera sp.]|uniref:UDP-glucose 4-epimerase GalE n=1 Tax=Methylotenera sp. TaxID=2051956 RepID=UPI0027342B4D|nr:UDP-glucose 4-epimerase GalE [Methylotenera sp.]MDP3308107.1 UDP-glucose 4-epimerase GalE [Methylotenera sp.]
MSILVTGGAGYIGSHTCLELLNAEFDVVVLDNFSNSKMESLKRVEKLTGRSLVFIHGDVRDRSCLRELFLQHKITSVIHFAGYKSVGESVRNPLSYYDNNVSGSVVLAEVMAEFGVKRIVFSSSATVYDTPGDNQIREDFPLGPINPYGRSKLMVEQVFQDLSASDSEWKIAVLRYFNPVGAHESGMIGEDPNGIPNNLMPYISQVAVGRLAELSVFGSDYPTRDGTGVRDYIHVVDLARGHLAALQALDSCAGLITVNLGTGKGCSVLELIRAFEYASGKSVPYRMVERRPGDSATCYADPGLAESLLGWRAKLDISAMCRDAWRWQSNNPQGY